MAGTRQLWQIVTTPGADAGARRRCTRCGRPAITCENCHWPEKFHGDEVRVFREYADDEKNTETVTTLTMLVGGGSAALGVGTGIHWHMNLDNEIEYVTTDAEARGDSVRAAARARRHGARVHDTRHHA